MIDPRSSEGYSTIRVKMIKIVLLILGLVVSVTSSAEAQLSNYASLDFLQNMDIITKPLDWFLHDFVPRLIDQKPFSQLPERGIFKDYAMEDESNDDAAYLSAQEMITRSGYHYELYEAIADDGYVTQITRLINPLADRRFLRYPPVLMEHGGTIDPTAYIIASSIQHHPEKWPRTASDGPITSWNRSLAFVLANNGFDVWLAETRGSSDKNRKYFPERNVKSIAEGQSANKNLTFGELSEELKRHTKWDYWNFSQDDIIAHEIKSHMDVVLERTKSTKLLMFTFSLSTPTSFGFFSLRPDYAEKVHALVSMAPIVSGEHLNKGLKLILETLCPAVPEFLGTFLLEDILFTQATRNFVIELSKSKWFKYSVIKAFSNYAMGASAKYQTLLDLNVLGHMLRSLSFKEAQQLCQQMRSNRLAKYNYGIVKNLKIYGTESPPEYKLSEFHIKDWIVVIAENDGLSTQDVYKHLMREVFPKPRTTVFAPGFNHLDLIAGFENDRYVNLPVLSFYQSRSTVPGIEHFHTLEHHGGARQLSFPGLDKLKFPSLDDINLPVKSLERNELFQAMNLTGDPDRVFDQLQANVQRMFSSLGNLGNTLIPKSSSKSESETDSGYDS